LINNDIKVVSKYRLRIVKWVYLLLDKFIGLYETIDGLVTADDVENGRPEGDMIIYYEEHRAGFRCPKKY
jgi:hypothetical protein